MKSRLPRTATLGIALLLLGAVAYFVVGRQQPEVPKPQPVADRTSTSLPDPEPHDDRGGLSVAAVTAERVAVTARDTTIDADSLGPGSVFGRVTDEDGLALVGIRMRYEPLLGRVVDADTDREGNYAIEGLALAHGSLRSTAEGYVPFKSGIELTNEEPRAHVDVVLVESHQLRVVLRRPDGAQFMQDWSSDANLFTDLHLTFGSTRPRVGEEVPADDRVDAVQIGPAWPDAPIGVWRVIQTPGVRGTFACLSLGMLVIDAQPMPWHADTLFLVADIDAVRDKLGHVIASVVDATTGLPIEGATLSFGTQAGAGSRVISDASGHARSRDLVPGPYRLTITDENHLDMHTSANVASGKDTDLGVVRLDAGIELSGRVEFPDGTTGVTPLVCCQVYFVNQQRYVGVRKSVSTAADGTFRFATLEKGHYAILPEVPGLTDPTVRDVTAFVAGQRLFDAQSGSVGGIVLQLPLPGSLGR